MTSSHHSSFSCFPIDLNEDQHPQLPFSSKPLAPPPPPPPSLSYPFILNPPHDHHDPLGGFFSGDHSQPLQFHEDDQAKVYVWHGGSSENPTVKSESGHKFSAAIKNKEYCRKENQTEKYNTSVKWMSSKMRIMRKMMNQDQAVGDSSLETSIQKFDDPNGLSSPVSQTNINNNNNSNNSSTNCNNTTIRVCSDCNTTKTPLWRSGPRGPKSLCNACGIRQRKARRAMAAAAAAAATSTNGGPIFGAGTSTAAAKAKVHHKEKKTNNIHLPFKKRCKFTAAAQGRGRKKFGFEDLTIILSKNSAFQRVFPQEEKEAAILLMALSYGLVHG